MVMIAEKPVCRSAIEFMRKQSGLPIHGYVDGFVVIKSNACCPSCHSLGANVEFENDITIYTCWECGHTYQHDDSRKSC